MINVQPAQASEKVTNRLVSKNNKSFIGFFGFNLTIQNYKKPMKEKNIF
jgi:hypothetical protein